MEDLPRLDILLYAHDGRGLGHASRTIAIGIALRRLYPSLKILFVSGCKVSQQLIGPAPLDWLKLPSYETTVENGKSLGARGFSNFEDHELGRIRAREIKQIISAYRPRLVLADHSPQGKHKELVPSLDHAEKTDTLFVLGMRGVIGHVGQLSSDLAASVFKQYYRGILWYGDSAILGSSQLEEISEQYESMPHECGYVSRLSEIANFCNYDRPDQTTVDGTVSIPWIGEKTPLFIQTLHNVLKKRPKRENWHLYLDESPRISSQLADCLEKLENCRIEEPSQKYIGSLLRSRCAVIYGGYNSLVDVLSLNLPTVVIERDMKDKEQQHHLNKLLESSCRLQVLSEDCSGSGLEEKINLLLRPQKEFSKPGICLKGAENAARKLRSLLLQLD